MGSRGSNYHVAVPPPPLNGPTGSLVIEPPKKSPVSLRTLWPSTWHNSIRLGRLTRWLMGHPFILRKVMRC